MQVQHKKRSFSSEVYKDKAAIAFARSLMLVLMLMLMLMSHASVDFFVLSFVLPCAYAYVASENQALEIQWKTICPYCRSVNRPSCC